MRFGQVESWRPKESTRSPASEKFFLDAPDFGGKLENALFKIVGIIFLPFLKALGFILANFENTF